MKTSLEWGNVLVVRTDISKEMFDRRATELIVRDEEGRPAFYVDVNETSPEITEWAIVCNTVVDGNLAVTMVLPKAEPTVDEVKQCFGTALVNVAEYMPKAVEQLSAEVAAIDGIFEKEIEEATAE